MIALLLLLYLLQHFGLIPLGMVHS